MKRYDSYKDSGVEWIGEIPSGWSTKKFGYLFRVVSIKNNINEINLSVYRDYGVIPRDSRDDNHNVVSNDTSNYKLVEIGDFVMNKMKCWMGSLGLSEYRGIVSPSYTVMKLTSQQHPKYLHHLLRSSVYIPEYRRLSYGVREGQWDLRFEDFREIFGLLPPFSEQQQIVSFLDSKTSQIDELIQKKERKIELLKEYRTSLINQVVTKGLNPNVEMKDSGVEWIGEIPSSWDTIRLKYVCSVTTGGKDTQDKVDDGLYPFYVRSPKIERINSYSFDGESVLTVGDGVGVGKVFHYVDGKFEFHQRVYKFSEFKRITGKFFFWFIKHHFIYVTEDQNSKSTVDSLRRPLIDEFPFVNPPLSEQKQIVEYLDEQTQKIDSSIQTEERKIELLKEYRQSLISSVVTGKIDVRTN